MPTPKKVEPPLQAAPSAAGGSTNQGTTEASAQLTTVSADSGLSVHRSAQTGSGDKAAPREMVFGSASGPTFRKQTQPVYPSQARRRGKEGTVLLRLSISETGQLNHIEILEDPGHGFAEAAQEAIRNSSFTPAHQNGKPIAVKATLPIRFTLR